MMGAREARRAGRKCRSAAGADDFFVTTDYLAEELRHCATTAWPPRNSIRGLGGNGASELRLHVRLMPPKAMMDNDLITVSDTGLIWRSSSCSALTAAAG